jgi:HSP20 family protein
MLTTRSLNTTLDRMLTLNRALDQAFVAPWQQSDANRMWVPAMDLVEQKDRYVLYAELPGVKMEDLEIGFEQNVLTIRGTKRSSLDPAAQGELRVYTAERVTGAFERSLKLPDFVDGDRISASFENGLLTVTVPKAQAAQARRIAINAAPAGDESRNA